MIDIEALTNDVMAQLGLTSLQDKIRVQNAARLTIGNILTYCDWNFLGVLDTVTITSTNNSAKMKDNFLYPILGSMKSTKGLIEIVSRSWLNVNFPDLSSLSGYPVYCIFEGLRKAIFYPVNAITSTLEIEFEYQRLGTLADLDVDPGFEQILRDGMVKNVVKLGTNEQYAASNAYNSGLKSKAMMFQRKFFGTSMFYPSKLTQAITVERKNLSWGKR